MALGTPSVIAEPKAHGIRPFGYKVEFATAPATGQFASPQNAVWTRRLVNLQQVVLGYGSSDQTANFSTYDPLAVNTDNLDHPQQWLQEPKNGECVRITINDQGQGTEAGTDNGERVIFKGTIRAVHDSKQPNAVIWSCKADSEVTRLNEAHFTGSFNYLNDPVNPSPHFDAQGIKVNAQILTIKEIIENILNYKDAWETTEYFTTASLDWGTGANDLSASPKCGGFKPSEIVFDATPKGKAIEEVLQRAGNYTFIYDPTTDKLRIVELNRTCSRCGPKWEIVFASTDADDDKQVAYASQYTVEDDKTTWSSEQSANVVRMLTGPIQFYSGHWIIPELANHGPVTGTHTDEFGVRSDFAPDHAYTVGHDTASNQRTRAITQDLSVYRFVTPSKACINDTREYKHYYVGMPLFPDWNIFEDWWPAMYEIGEVILPNTWVPPSSSLAVPVAGDYLGKIEFQPYCIGDQVARESAPLGFQDNLRAYQAYYAVDPCPACAGSGLVKKVYDNTDNEPAITLVDQGHPPRKMPQVTNYLMKPAHFGMIPMLPYTIPGTPAVAAKDGQAAIPAVAAVAVSATHPFGLLPFDPTDTSDPVVAQTKGYPLPWKNTCPFCRGVGRWPKFKIRNINGELFRGHNLKISTTSARGEVPTDPDQTATGPETWEEANNRLATACGPMLQVEAAVMNGKFVLPTYMHRNLPYFAPSDMPTALNLKGLPEDDQVTPVATAIKRWPFPHPLQFASLKKVLPGLNNDRIAAVRAAGLDLIVPKDWRCQVPTTTIQMNGATPHRIDYKMGRVMFAEPVFIPCYKNYSAIQVVCGTKAILTQEGRLSTESPARGWRMADERGLPTGYWRPARIWMTFLYSRERYFMDGTTTPARTAIPVTEFEHYEPDSLNAQGTPLAGARPNKYEARAVIVDGCYGVEVRKSSPPQTGNSSQPTEIGFTGRIIQRVYRDATLRLKVFEDDFWRSPVPPKPESDQPFKDYIAWKDTTKGNLFTQGKLLRWDRTTPGEALVEAAGWTDADHFGSYSRPKIYTSYLWDDRPRMLDLAVRRLESANDIQVGGSLALVGPTGDTRQGLGYVDYPLKGKATVVRLVYNFTNGFVTELELHREETRIGELPPEEKNRQDKVEKDLATLSKRVEVQHSLAAEHDPQGPQEAPNEPSVADHITGGS